MTLGSNEIRCTLPRVARSMLCLMGEMGSVSPRSLEAMLLIDIDLRICFCGGVFKPLPLELFPSSQWTLRTSLNSTQFVVFHLTISVLVRIIVARVVISGASLPTEVILRELSGVTASRPAVDAAEEFPVPGELRPARFDIDKERRWAR